MPRLLPDPAYFASLPTVISSGAVILRDEDGRFVVEKPNYRDHWLLPGGGVDPGEDPRSCAQREVAEELGLDVEVGRVLAIDWMPSSAVRSAPMGVHFVFDAGVIPRAQLEATVVPQARGARRLGADRRGRRGHPLPLGRRPARRALAVLRGEAGDLADPPPARSPAGGATEGATGMRHDVPRTFLPVTEMTMSPSPTSPRPVPRDRAAPLTRSQRLDRLPFTRKHGKLLGASGIGWALDAMDVGLISFVIAALSVHWGISKGDGSLIASAGFAGHGDRRECGRSARRPDRAPHRLRPDAAGLRPGHGRLRARDGRRRPDRAALRGGAGPRRRAAGRLDADERVRPGPDPRPSDRRGSRRSGRWAGSSPP